MTERSPIPKPKPVKRRRRSSALAPSLPVQHAPDAQYDVALGALIAKWRQDHGLSQAKLAQSLGTSTNRIGEWERRGVPAPDAGLVRLAMRSLEASLKA